ncbi:MAG: hypothetical protein COT71_01510 [Candidatus Andersenbacteria bacterium CG10_big_fil_rev_8_21_14_0_10_54_11]|uniref:3D domain-containing protein n=1 Tax=Candidatus Andersenbacteria bacterium CG10_big_fil_rev_8_21_14_0_10_54_11 TaxID=1974485 RepID=A0A2M6WZP1_9BACT|nr:MAG: hypothetical protein COT71_01510 [Candidatus Andersenbacteria bacterium CG10_big_fil_rev_8_21_14_0_10_54_11]
MWSFLYDILNGFTVAIYLLLTLFPGRVMAYANEQRLGMQPLTFVRDPSLTGRAVVGIEVYGRNQRVVDLLASDALQLRASSGEGSVVRVLATAYSSAIEQTDGDPFTTASGVRVGSGVLAANFLPFGTRVRIGQQIYTVLDRLNPRFDRQYVVDLWMPSRQAALQYGARVVEMEVISLP